MAPSIFRIIIESRGSYLVEAEYMVNVEVLEINITFDRPLGNMSVTYTGLGLSYGNKSYHVEGNTLTLYLDRAGFPGVGVTGTDVIAEIDSGGAVPVNASAHGGVRRTTPHGEESEPATIGSIEVAATQPPAPEPPYTALLVLAATTTYIAITMISSRNNRQK